MLGQKATFFVTPRNQVVTRRIGNRRRARRGGPAFTTTLVVGLLCVILAPGQALAHPGSSDSVPEASTTTGAPEATLGDLQLSPAEEARLVSELSQPAQGAEPAPAEDEREEDDRTGSGGPSAVDWGIFLGAFAGAMGYARYKNRGTGGSASTQRALAPFLLPEVVSPAQCITVMLCPSNAPQEPLPDAPAPVLDPPPVTPQRLDESLGAADGSLVATLLVPDQPTLPVGGDAPTGQPVEDAGEPATENAETAQVTLEATTLRPDHGVVWVGTGDPVADPQEDEDVDDVTQVGVPEGEVIVPGDAAAPVVLKGGQPERAPEVWPADGRFDLKLNLSGAHNTQGTPTPLSDSAPALGGLLQAGGLGPQFLLPVAEEQTFASAADTSVSGSNLLLQDTILPNKFTGVAAPASEVVEPAEVFAPGPVELATELDPVYANLTAGALP